MSASAVQVNELRVRSGAGMMACKAGVEITVGDTGLAIEDLRRQGKAKADKKSTRIAAEGVVHIQVSNDSKQAIMVEVNSETDFVGRDENFLKFVKAVSAVALQAKAHDIAAINDLS